MHRGGSKVKSYYSSGSLSFVTPELWSFFAMYGELMSHPAYVDPIPPPTPPPVGSNLEAATAFGPHHWFSEHAATALFSSDWTTPLSHPTNSPICDGCDMDVSFTTRANSRLANFWSRLLVLATDELDIDGIYLGQSSSLFSSCSFWPYCKTIPQPTIEHAHCYLRELSDQRFVSVSVLFRLCILADGVAYDAHTMLRAARAVSTGRGFPEESGGHLDLHCGNRWPSGGGEIDVLEYAQHMSLMDSVMFGEGFDDGGNVACSDRQSGTCGDATWMLLATSGLPFGVFNDMLTDVNVHRGMVFGMWGRPPYSSSAQNKALWAWMDASGLSANSTEMLGWYADQPDWHAVVSSSETDIKATAFLVQPSSTTVGQVIIAVASWAEAARNVSLKLVRKKSFPHFSKGYRNDLPRSILVMPCAVQAKTILRSAGPDNDCRKDPWLEHRHAFRTVGNRSSRDTRGTKWHQAGRPRQATASTAGWPDAGGPARQLGSCASYLEARLLWTVCVGAAHGGRARLRRALCPPTL